MRKEQVQTFGPTGRFQDLKAVLLEQQLASDKAVPVVVNTENRCFSPRHFSHPFRPGLLAASDVRPDEELHCWTSEVVGRLILTTAQCVFKLRMCTKAAVTAISHAIFARDFQTGS